MACDTACLSVVDLKSADRTDLRFLDVVEVDVVGGDVRNRED